MSELEQLHKQLEKIAKSYVKKSVDGRELTPKQARAVAITKASTESPAGRQIARRIMQLEKQQAASFAYAVPVAKAMGGFSHENGPLEAHTDDELLEKLEEITRELKRRGFVEEEA
jgi:Mg2+ and Co2+ transporter CorA